MLEALFLHIIIISSCAWTGFLFYNYIFRIKEDKSIVFYFITGLVAQSILVQNSLLFIPINKIFSLIILVLLSLIALFRKKDIIRFCKIFIQEISSLSLNRKILLTIIWIILLMISCGPTMMDDTESYHIQSIKWIQEYGSVPGLANLHERFGFNSSWFSSVAFFSFSQNSFTILNGVLSIVVSYWLLRVFNTQRPKNIRAAFSMMIAFITSFLIWSILRGNAASTNYDFISTSIVLVLFIEIFLAQKFSPTIEWLIWPAYLFTVRVVNYPALLFSIVALIFFIRQKQFRIIYSALVCCLLLTIPFITRNIIISGYPFYPALNFDLFKFDWKADINTTEKVIEYIRFYNRVPTTYFDIEQTKALGANWIPSWFKYLFFHDKIIVVSGTIGILISLVISIVKKVKSEIYLLSATVLWLTSWFLVAPDPRFIYGIFLFGVFLFTYNCSLLIGNTQILKQVTNFMIVGLVFCSSYYLLSKLWNEKEYRNFLSPMDLPQPPVKEFTIDGVILRIPERIFNNWNPRCYGTPLPCLYVIDPKLKPRGKSIGDGFRIEK